MALPVPENLVIENRKPDSFRVKWDQVPNVSTFEMEVSSGNQPSAIFKASNPQDVKELVQLQANKVYNIRVRSISPILKSDFSQWISTITRPPKPEAPLGSDSMTARFLRLFWNIQLPQNADLSHVLFVELRRSNDQLILHSQLPLSGFVLDIPNQSPVSYSLRLYSDCNDVPLVLRNESDWSDELLITKSIFSNLESHSHKLNNQTRLMLMRSNSRQMTY